MANTREDLQTAYGAPTAETQGKLLVFKKDQAEYHVDLNAEVGRASLISQLPPSGRLWSQDEAMTEVRKLFPKDVQTRSTQPEGNQQFVIERFSSPSLAQALPAGVWRERGGQPGDFLAIYEKDSQGRITRIVIGAGSDPALLLKRAGE